MTILEQTVTEMCKWLASDGWELHDFSESCKALGLGVHGCLTYKGNVVVTALKAGLKCSDVAFLMTVPFNGSTHEALEREVEALFGFVPQYNNATEEAKGYATTLYIELIGGGESWIEKMPYFKDSENLKRGRNLGTARVVMPTVHRIKLNNKHAFDHESILETVTLNEGQHSELINPDVSIDYEGVLEAVALDRGEDPKPIHPDMPIDHIETMDHDALMGFLASVDRRDDHYDSMGGLLGFRCMDKQADAVKMFPDHPEYDGRITYKIPDSKVMDFLDIVLPIRQKG